VETVIYVIYFLLGPLFWSFFGVALVKSEKRMRLVRNPPDPIPDEPPLVTVIVPAKDEAIRIAMCLQSVLKLDYANFNVIAVNDRSDDETGKIMDSIAAADSRLRVIHIQPGTLPPNWSGKNHALHVGSQGADGDWLLFVDADVILYPQVLRLTMGMALCREYDLVSLMPKIEFHSFWEGMLTPLGAFATAMLHVASLTNTNNRPQTAFANGQYMLFKRAVYQAIGGHERVRDVLGEDTALARILKRSGYRPRVSWGADLCQVRMYDSFGKILRGWARILFATAESPWRNVVGLVGLFVLGFSVIPAAAWGIYRIDHPGRFYAAFFWLTGSSLHWVLMTVMLGTMYAMAGTKKWYAVLFLPISGPLLLYMLARSVYLGISKRVEWRGTRYAGASASATG